MVRTRNTHGLTLSQLANQVREASQADRTWPILQQRGLRRTGTNWARMLILKNFRVHLDEINKHGAYPEGGPRVNTVLMTRDIYSWLPSYHRLLKIKHGPSVPDDLATFIQCVGMQDVNQFAADTTLLPVDFYCAAYRNWLYTETDKTIHRMKWEDLLFDQNYHLTILKEKFGLQSRHDSFVNVDMEIGPKNYLHQPSGSSWSEESYNKNEEFMNNYSPEMLKWIANKIDTTVMSSLGYRVRV